MSVCGIDRRVYPPYIRTDDLGVFSEKPRLLVELMEENPKKLSYGRERENARLSCRSENACEFGEFIDGAKFFC